MLTSMLFLINITVRVQEEEQKRESGTRWSERGQRRQQGSKTDAAVSSLTQQATRNMKQIIFTYKGNRTDTGHWILLLKMRAVAGRF